MLNVNLCKIKEYVETLARKERIKSFYPQTLSRRLGIPLDLVVLELPKLVEEGCIKLRYEIRCNDDLCTLDTVDNYMDVLDTKMFCYQCGEEIDILLSNIYPIYYITDDYKEYVKKNKSKN